MDRGAEPRRPCREHAVAVVVVAAAAATRTREDSHCTAASRAAGGLGYVSWAGLAGVGTAAARAGGPLCRGRRGRI